MAVGLHLCVTSHISEIDLLLCDMMSAFVSTAYSICSQGQDRQSLGSHPVIVQAATGLACCKHVISTCFLLNFSNIKDVEI